MHDAITQLCIESDIHLSYNLSHAIIVNTLACLIRSDTSFLLLFIWGFVVIFVSSFSTSSTCVKTMTTIIMIMSNDK